MADPRPVFYFDTNSPYAYLAAMRIREALPDAQWRPIALAMLFREIGKVPWSLREGREAQMREIEERAAARGLPPVRWAEGWPAETWSFAPLRAAVVAEEHDRLVPFALECYRLLFAEERSLAELDNVLEAARAVGLDPDEVRARIAEQDVKDRLRAYTDEAVARGAIGVPTVAVGGELFWGDDRLDDAAAAADAATCGARAACAPRAAQRFSVRLPLPVPELPAPSVAVAATETGADERPFSAERPAFVSRSTTVALPARAKPLAPLAITTFFLPFVVVAESLTLPGSSTVTWTRSLFAFRTFETLLSSTRTVTFGPVVSPDDDGGGAGAPAPVTFSVPVMNGWIVQKNP